MKRPTPHAHLRTALALGRSPEIAPQSSHRPRLERAWALKVALAQPEERRPQAATTIVLIVAVTSSVTSTTTM